MKLLRCFVAVALLTGTSCLGTISSRAMPTSAGGVVGWPCAAALTYDALVVSGHSRAYPRDGGHVGGLPLFVAWAFVSVPLDLVFDAVLLPVDAVAGAFGARRHAPGVVSAADEGP